MVDYAWLNFETEACGTDVWELWECNGESIQGVAEVESVIAQPQAVHLFLLRYLTLRSESSFLFMVNSRLNYAHL